MADNVERINSELEALGLSTELTDSPKGRVVSFDYEVNVGSYRGTTVRVGLSMQGKEPYPEYPTALDPRESTYRRWQRRGGRTVHR